jgi:hypothetical protein
MILEKKSIVLSRPDPRNSLLIPEKHLAVNGYAAESFIVFKAVKTQVM